jgi:hypothetical protein
VILEDDVSDTPSLKAAAICAAGADPAFEPTKATDPPGHGPWWDVEDDCFIDDDLCLYPPLEQERLASTPA